MKGRIHREGASELRMVMSGAYRFSLLVVPILSVKQETVMCEMNLGERS